LQAQAARKAKGRQKRMKAFRTVNIPQEAFIEVLKTEVRFYIMLVKSMLTIRHLCSIAVCAVFAQGCQTSSNGGSVETTAQTLKGQLVFVDETRNAVCVANANGTQKRVLAENGRYPRWFPSGDKIVYVTHWADPGEIVIVSLDGTVLKRFPCTGQLAEVNEVSDVSLDGSELLLAKNGIESKGSDIYRLNIETGVMTKVLTPGDVAALVPKCKEIYVCNGSWSHNGNEIAFTVGCRGLGAAIGVIKKDGTALRLITDFPAEGSQWGGFFNYGWSPDGKKVLATNYKFAPSGQRCVLPYGAHIFVIDVDKKSVRQIPTDDKYERSDPCWSPDGMGIVYSEKRVYTESNVDVCLVVINAAGTNPQRIFPRKHSSFLPYEGGQNDIQPRWWGD
jgi:Tol biopolymer transport system component